MPDYDASFPAGTAVRIVAGERLRAFKTSWKYHNPLRDEQMGFAARTAVVVRVGYYHGGDPLYELAGIPGVWHEACLESA